MIYKLNSTGTQMPLRNSLETLIILFSKIRFFLFFKIKLITLAVSLLMAFEAGSHRSHNSFSFLNLSRVNPLPKQINIGSLADTAF